MSRILIVEDDPASARLAYHVVTSAGYDVVTAWNGREALAALATMDALPNMILLDLEMPIMDGWQALAAIRADVRLADIPVIVMSANSDERLVGHKAVLRIDKPYSTENLLMALRAFAPI